MNEWVLLAIGVLLTCGTGLFVASEFALVNLDRSELEAREGRGERRLGGVIKALKKTSTHLSSAQLGITLTTLMTGSTFTPAIEKLLSPSLSQWGVADEVLRVLAPVLGVTIATFFSMLIGELLPKNLALALPLEVAKVVSPAQRLFTAVFLPAIYVLNGSANAILRAIGIEPKEELSGARSAEELSSLVRRSAMHGALDADAATLLSRTLRFTELQAGDIMTPRPSVQSIDKHSSVDDLVQLARSTGHSRFPIAEDDLDRVTGIAHLKQAIAVPREKRAEVPVQAIATEPHRVPETLGLDALLADLKERSYQMAVVIDEYGGTAGIVTLEDLVEEIVGEVSDEHDRSRADVIRRGTSTTLPGMLRPDEALERAGVSIPEDAAYETVGGFMMAQLGTVPKVGDVVTFDKGTLRVERMEGRRVDRVRWTPLDATQEAGQ